MLKKMVRPGERIAEEEGSEDADDADILSSDISSSGTSDIPPSPSHTHGKAKKTKDKEPFYKGYGVVYLPGDINGLTK